MSDLSSSPSFTERLPPDLQGLAQELLNQLNRDFWTSDIDTNGKRGMLYHYTNSDGLKGVLESGQLWASNAAFLNDTMEATFARNLVKDEFHQLATAITPTILKQLVAEFMKNWDQVLTEDVYVTSFCEEGDLLSQWRGYAQEGAGFALGFDASGELPNESVTGIRLRKVVYKENEQRDRIRNTFRRAQKVADDFARSPKLSNDMRATFASEVALHLIASLFEYPLFLKHWKWSEEKEWRLVRAWSRADLEQHLEGIDFHQRRGLWVPHVKLQVQFRELASQEYPRVDLWCLPLRKIIVGPAIDFPLARESIRLMLRKWKINPQNVEIEQSQVPLR